MFHLLSGRWASPRRAVFVSLYTACCAVRTLFAEPFWLSLCFAICVHTVNVSSVAACAGVGGEIPSRCAHESTHTSLAVALVWLEITCRPVWGACTLGRPVSRDVQYGILIVISAVPAAGMCYISPPECYEALGAKDQAKIARHGHVQNKL